MSKYTASIHSIYNIGYYIVFYTKYRYKLLRYGAETMLRRLLTETMPEHVHLFVTASPSLLIHGIVKYLKRYSSYCLRKQYA